MLNRLDVSTVELLEGVRIGRDVQELPPSRLSGHVPPPFSPSLTLRRRDAGRYKTSSRSFRLVHLVARAKQREGRALARSKSCGPEG
jgi:hypothetical protein